MSYKQPKLSWISPTGKKIATQQQYYQGVIGNRNYSHTQGILISSTQIKCSLDLSQEHEWQFADYPWMEMLPPSISKAKLKKPSVKQKMIDYKNDRKMPLRIICSDLICGNSNCST